MEVEAEVGVDVGLLVTLAARAIRESLHLDMSMVRLPHKVTGQNQITLFAAHATTFFHARILTHDRNGSKDSRGRWPKRRPEPRYVAPQSGEHDNSQTLAPRGAGSYRVGVAFTAVSFVCAVVQHRRRGPLDKGAWGWPFGRVQLGDDDLRAWLTGLGHFALRIPYSDIVGAVATPSRLRGGRLRLQRIGARGDVTIATLNDSYRSIGEALREKGVHVADA